MMSVRQWMLIVGAAATAVVLVSLVPRAQAQRPVLPPSDLPGSYAVTGSSPTGTYTAALTLTPHGPVYEARWTFPQGDFMVGVGFLHEGQLVIGFEPTGVIVYSVGTEIPLTLSGRWTGWGFESVHEERAVKGPPAIRARR